MAARPSTEAVDEVDATTSARIVAPLPRVTTNTRSSHSSHSTLSRPHSPRLASPHMEVGAAGVEYPLPLLLANGDSFLLPLVRVDSVEASLRHLREFARLEVTLGLPGMTTEEVADTTVLVAEEEAVAVVVTETTVGTTATAETEDTMVTDGPGEAISFLLKISAGALCFLV